MRILVTNDDGVDAPTIVPLARAMADAGHDVRVVAPDADHSGCGASLGSWSSAMTIRFERARPPGLDGIEAWRIDGPPARGVLVVVRGGLGWMPDAVVSGVNPGNNVGLSVLYSGTVGAVLAARAHRISGLAVSASGGDDASIERAAALAPAALEWVATQAPGTAVNLNTPSAVRPLRGVRAGRLDQHYLNACEPVPSEDPEVLEVRLRPLDPDLDADSDRSLLAHGFAVVSPLTGPSVSADVDGEALAAVLDAEVGR